MSSNTRPGIGRRPPSRAGARAAWGCLRHRWVLGSHRCAQSAAGPPPGDPPWQPGAAAGFLSHPGGSPVPCVSTARAQNL